MSFVSSMIQSDLGTSNCSPRPDSAEVILNVIILILLIIIIIIILKPRKAQGIVYFVARSS